MVHKIMMVIENGLKLFVKQCHKSPIRVMVATCGKIRGTDGDLTIKNGDRMGCYKDIQGTLT